MDEQDCQLLSMLERTKNITRAADYLFFTQSYISKRIFLLEKELGVTLMLRSRKGIHFTPQGEVVLKHVHALEKEWDLMRQELEQSQDIVAGTLRAGISINYALYRLPDQLAEYRRLYPHVKTQITTANSRDLYKALLNDQIDVAILRGEYNWKGERLLLAREKICLITNRANKDIPLNELPQIARHTDIELEREISQWMKEHKITADPNGIVVDNIATCVEMVKRGLGWSIVPEICLTGFSGIIRPLHFANGEPLLRSTYLMYSPDTLDFPQIHAFISMLRESLRKTD